MDNYFLIDLCNDMFPTAFPERKEMTEENETKKTQWHPAFCSAMKLELVGNKKDLDYISEHELNTKPIRIDLLVIEKTEGVTIENEIGKIFKIHNIIEYKSPDDELNVDTYFKVLAYACLYKSQASTVNGIAAEDITISIVREQKPVGLLRWFEEQGCEIEQKYKGIYYIRTNFFFDTQILVLKELNPEMHLWLTSLSKKLSRPRAEKLLTTMNELSAKDEREYADSILEVVMKANKTIFSKFKEVPYMCEELAKLFEPEMKEATRLAKTVGRVEGESIGEIKLIRKKYAKGYDVEQTAEMIEQEESFVSDIYKLLEDYPECSDEELVDIYMKENNKR